jgi:hypothetical protein
MVYKKIVLTFFLVLTLLNSAFALSPEVTDLNINPTMIWLNQNPSLTISAKCRYNGSYISNAVVTAAINAPGGSSTEISLTYSSGKYVKTISNFQWYFSEPGTYDVTVKCEHDGGSDTAAGTFAAHELELDILEEGEKLDAYMGDYLTLKIYFKMDGNLLVCSEDDFKVRIGDEDVDVVSAIKTANYQEVKVAIPVDSSDLPEGTYDLKVTAYNSGKSVTDDVKDYIKINSPLKIDITQSEIECPANTPCKPEITVDVKFPIGDVTDFAEEDFSALIMGRGKTFKKIYVDSIDCSKQSGSCNIKLDIPANLEPGSYDMFLTLNTNIENEDYESQDSIPLEIVLRISGTLKDAAGNVVSSILTFENLETGQSMSGQTGPSGEYSLNILPGDYSVEMRFGGGVVTRFYNVTISGSDSLLGLSGNLVRYDQGHLNSGSPAGVRVVKIIVVEFGLPFSNAWFYVPYDSSKVSGDEKDLKVYNCRDWNFEKSSCTGAWEKVTCQVHTIRDGAEFNAYSTGAFIIGEQRGLHFSNIELESEEVYMGDTVVVNGKLLDTDGNAVENAQIRLSFPVFNMSASSVTTTGGFFRATLNAPYLTGYPDMLVEGIKYPYCSCNETKTVKVTKSKELSILNIPDIADVPLNEPTDITFSLFNSGQTNLTETIYIHVNGISSDWYELSPAKINGLGISEQKDITLRVYLTPELCGGACMKFTLVNIEAASDEISRAVSFTIKITSPLNETETPAVEGEGGGSIFPDITGFAISMPSVSSPYLPLTVIVILIVLIVNKNKTGSVNKAKKTSGKQGKKGHELRTSITSSLHRIKKSI